MDGRAKTLRFSGRIEFVARFTLILDKHHGRSDLERAKSGMKSGRLVTPT